MIIDSHAHIFKQRWIHEPWRQHPPERLVMEMKRAGVDKAILFFYLGKDILTPTIDVDVDYYVQAYRKSPDKFVWFADSIDPANKDYMNEVERNIQKGAKGIKLFMGFRSTLPDDQRYHVLYKRCADMGLPIIMGFERWNDPHLLGYTDYDRLLGHFESIAKEYGNINFILPHCGCFFWGERRWVSCKPPFQGLQSLVKLLNKYNNVYTDIAAVNFICGNVNTEEWPYPTILKMLETLIEGVGVEKVIWGTDWPHTELFCTYKQCLTMITRGATFLNEQEKLKIVGGNVAKLLNL